MSDTLGRKVWIESFILSCARKYGSKFAKPTEQKGYRVQLIEFLTQRTPEQPGAAVWALASDGQYYIPIKFVPSAVNEFLGIDGKLATLEDHWCGIFILKGTFTLQYYRIPRKYINGKPCGLEDAKKLYLEVTRVQYLGSMHEPIFIRPRILKRDGMPDLVIQQEAVESVGNVAAVKRWMENLEREDGDILKREWDAQNAEEVTTKSTNVEQWRLSVRVPTASQDPRPLPSADKRRETDCAPSEHWPSFWKQAFKEHPWLFNFSSSEGSIDEEYVKEGDADAKHEILVPILPTDEPLGPPVEMEAMNQPLELRPSSPVSPISPGVPNTPHFPSSPSLILTDWTLTPPPRLRTRSNNTEGEANTSSTSGESSRFLEEGNTTSSPAMRTEHSSASNGLSLEANEANSQVLIPSSGQARPRRERPLGTGSLICLQLSPRRTQKHRGELRTEYSTSHTTSMHPTKRDPTPKSFPPSQPLFSQPQATPAQEIVPAFVEGTSQEVTSSDSIRIPPGQVAVTQQSRSTQNITAPGSPIFMDGLFWDIITNESIGFSPSGQIAVTQESQEPNPTSQNISQNIGEGQTSFKTPGPLLNRDHRWKSRQITAMLSSPPIYPTLSASISPAAGTSVGPMDSVSLSSDGDIAYRQYMEDNLRVKERERSPASCEYEMGSQLEIDELDGLSPNTPSADGSGESDQETDNKEGPDKRAGIMAGEEEHTPQLSSDVEVDEQRKPRQGVIGEQEARQAPGPEVPSTQISKRVEAFMQPAEVADLKVSAHIGPPDTEECVHQKRTRERTPVQESPANILDEPRAKEVKVMQREQEENNETEIDGGTHEAENHSRGGIERMLPSEAHETVEFTALLETTHGELQDLGLQQELLRTHSHSPLIVTVSTSLHWSAPRVSKARAPRRLPWLVAESDGHSSSVSISPPPPPPKQCRVLGKRKRVSVGDDVREQARTPPPSSILKISAKQANFLEVLLQPPVQHHGVIKRRKIEFSDTPLKVDFEESGSESGEITIDNWRPKGKRDVKGPAIIQVQDGSPFSRNKPSRPPNSNFDVPSPLPPGTTRGASSTGGVKVQSSRSTLHAHQMASGVVPSTSLRDQQPMVLPVHRPRRVSAQSNTVRQRTTHPISSRATTRYASPVSSLFHDDRRDSYRPSTGPRRSLSYTNHSEFSECGDDMSILSTETLPHVDFLKRGTSSTRSLRK